MQTTDVAARAGSALDSVLANPLVGLAPWIVYSIVEGKGRLEVSAAIALGVAVLVLTLNWLRGESPKLFEFVDAAYFAGLTVLVAVASSGTRSWLELWGGEMANVALLSIALGSIVIRRPFTLPYAREGTPEEVWHEPEFLRVNSLIAWVWVGAFAIGAASGFVGDGVLHNADNIWTGWIIQTFPLIVAAQFTIWYPARLEAVRDGRAESSPHVEEFLATVTPWIATIGIICVSVSGTPPVVGISLIVAGVLLTKTFASKDDEPGACSSEPRR